MRFKLTSEQESDRECNVNEAFLFRLVLSYVAFIAYFDCVI